MALRRDIKIRYGQKELRFLKLMNRLSRLSDSGGAVGQWGEVPPTKRATERTYLLFYMYVVCKNHKNNRPLIRACHVLLDDIFR